MRADPSLAEELNIFYGRFDRNGGASCADQRRQEAADRAAMLIMFITVSEDEVRRELRRL